MSKIKSALELAMEKTSHIEADPAALKRAEAQKSAKLNTALFLKGESEDLIPGDIDEMDLYRETVKATLMTNLKLPRINEDLPVLSRLEEAFSYLSKGRGEKKEIKGLFGQIKQFFSQYLDTREQLLETLSAQYEPQLRRKEEALRKQTGQSITLTPEQDPEFIKLLQDQQQMMDDQYNQVISQAKEQLSTLL